MAVCAWCSCAFMLMVLVLVFVEVFVEVRAQWCVFGACVHVRTGGGRESAHRASKRFEAMIEAPRAC